MSNFIGKKIQPRWVWSRHAAFSPNKRRVSKRFDSGVQIVNLGKDDKLIFECSDSLSSHAMELYQTLVSSFLNGDAKLLILSDGMKLKAVIRGTQS